MKFRITLLSLLVIFTFSSCKKDDFKINGTIKQLPNDVIVLNEGSFGKSNGSFSYFSYSDTPSMLKFGEEYIDKTQNGFGGTSCYAKHFGSTIYVVSKDAPFLSRFSTTNGATFNFKDIVVDELSEGEQAHAVDIAIYLPEVKASALVYYNFILTTTKNIYNVDINNKKIKRLSDTEKGYYDIISCSEDETFVITDDGLELFNKRGFYKNLGPATGGFAVSMDRNLWAANYNADTDKTELLKITPKTLEIERLPIDINLKPSAWPTSEEYGKPAWKTTPLIASMKENALFFLEYPDGDNYKLYKYDIKTDKVTTLLELDPTKESFASSSIVYSPLNNEIIAVTKVPGYDFLNKNSILVIDAGKGTIKERVNYDGFYFPTQLILNENKFQFIENE